MTLKALKSEISELQAEKAQLFEKSKLSVNGIVYFDHKPLVYCSTYGFIPPQSLEIEKCRKCSAGKEVLELTEETREMWLDGDGRVNDYNRGKDDPVTAELVFATIQLDHGKTEKRLVCLGSKDVKYCPRGW